MPATIKLTSKTSTPSIMFNHFVLFSSAFVTLMSTTLAGRRNESSQLSSEVAAADYDNLSKPTAS